MRVRDFKLKDSYDLSDAVDIVAVLRDPDDGCPWDLEQTHESIRKNFLEETYEVCDAIDKGDKTLLCEELGDVFLQIALHAEIERASGGFDINAVADMLVKKLIHRHPHVFGDAAAGTSGEVLAAWERIKRDEKKQTTAKKAIDDVPRALPALARTQKVCKRAADFGLDFGGADEALRRIRDAVDGIEQNGVTELSIGSLLFECAALARQGGVDAEQAATRSCNDFIERFKTVEAAADERG